jgi:hypothetical protein
MGDTSAANVAGTHRTIRTDWNLAIGASLEL